MPQDYAVAFMAPAVEAIMALSKSDQRRVVSDCKKLKRAPTLGEALGCKPVDLTGCRRLRVGRLRVVYQVNDEQRVVTVIAVGAREDHAVYEVAAAQLQGDRLRRIK